MSNNELIAAEDTQPTFDLENPRSVVNLLSSKVRQRVIEVFSKNPKLLSMTEVQLKRELDPSESAQLVRLSFWREYQRAQDANQKMKMTNIYKPVMGDELFYTEFLPNDRYVAWMMQKPTELSLVWERELFNGTDQIMRIMRMNLFDENGNLKTSDARIFLKVYELLVNRVHGLAIKRIEMKTQNIPIGPANDELLSELDRIRDVNGQEETD